MKKFDVIIGNPPYRCQLHLKFLAIGHRLLKQGGDLLFVHPAASFVSIKPSRLKTISNELVVDIVSLKLINLNNLFDAAFFVPSSITHVNKGYNQHEVQVQYLDGQTITASSLGNVNLFGNEELVFSLLAKFLTGDSLQDHTTYRKGINTDFNFIVDIAAIRGHSSKQQIHTADLHTFIPRDFEVKTHASKKFNPLIFGFDTIAQANNFVTYLKTNFARRALSMYKINQHNCTGELQAVPWLDFTQEWTDERLTEHFNLTEAEQAFVNSIPRYY